MLLILRIVIEKDTFSQHNRSSMEKKKHLIPTLVRPSPGIFTRNNPFTIQLNQRSIWWSIFDLENNKNSTTEVTYSFRGSKAQLDSYKKDIKKPNWRFSGWNIGQIVQFTPVRSWKRSKKWQLTWVQQSILQWNQCWKSTLSCSWGFW